MNETNLTRLRILLIAKEKFAKYDYTRVKIDDIASEMGISKRTLYEYFPSKKTLLSEVLNDVLNEFKTKLDEYLNSIIDKENPDFFEALLKILDMNFKAMTQFSKEFFEDIRKNTPEEWNKLQDFKLKQIEDKFYKMYNIGVKSGYIKSDIDKNVLFLIHYHSIQGIMQPEVITQLSLSEKEVIQNIIEILLTGVLTDNAKEKYISKKFKKLTLT